MDSERAMDMAKYLIPAALFFFLFVSMNACNEKDREINRLNRQIDELNAEHQSDLHHMCQEAIDRACNYADCAVMSIEQIQDEVCRRLENK